MSIREQVEEALQEIRARLQSHGGDVELVDVLEDEGIVQVRLQGACKGCPMAQMTLRMGIEETLKENISAVREVQAVE